MVNEDVYTRLSTDSDLAELVGDRIYPVAPQADDTQALPYVVYSVESIHSPNLDGLSPTAQHSVNVACIARKQSEAEAVAALVRGLLSDWSSGSIQWSFLTGATTEQTGDALGYVATLTFDVWSV